MLTLCNIIDHYSPNKYIEVIWDKPDHEGSFEAYSGLMMHVNNSLLCKKVLYLDNSNAFLHVVLEKY